MKLRFKVDQAQCLRRGIDCPKSIVAVEVNPAEMEPSLRNLIADRLSGGIDVCSGDVAQGDVFPSTVIGLGVGDPNLIVADGPDQEDLFNAVRADQKRLEPELKKQAASLDRLEQIRSTVKQPSV